MLYKIKRVFRRIDIKRRVKWFIERRRYGCDSRDTWSLDLSMVQWLLPRLKLFKKVNNGIPHDLTEEQWDRYLDRMIDACELYIKHGCWIHPKTMGLKDFARVVRGRNLFIKYYNSLWW